MIADEPIARQAEAVGEAEWCYLVSLGGGLYALPDNERTVLLPFISSVPQVTPMPKGLVPHYILGLINVAQRGEVLIDLPRMLGLRTGSAAPSVAENQRIVVLGEGTPPELGEYRLAFAVDYGYELFQAVQSAPAPGHPLGDYVSALVGTPHGEAALLDMERVSNTVLGDLGAERFWNQAPSGLEEDEAEA